MEIEINVFIQVNVGSTPAEQIFGSDKKRTVRADSLFLCFRECYARLFTDKNRSIFCSLSDFAYFCSL